MLMPSQGVRILVATKPVDFRKGHDGLAALVQSTLAEDPFTGTVFVFRSKRADRLKILFWDGSGLVMAYKRLEESTFTWPAIRDGAMTLNRAQFEALFAGLDWRRVRSLEVRRPAGRPGLGGAGFQHTEPTPEDLDRMHSLPGLRGATEPADPLSGHHCVMPCRAVDTTGIKAEGEGEWNARKLGGAKRRLWRKIHIGVDEQTLEIRAIEVTGSNVRTAPMLPERLGQIPDKVIASVTADGAFDTRRCYDAIADRGAHAVIPPRKNARPWKPSTAGAIARNEALRASKYLGRAIWRKWSGYHRRSRVETKMHCVKLLGQSPPLTYSANVLPGGAWPATSIVRSPNSRSAPPC